MRPIPKALFLALAVAIVGVLGMVIVFHLPTILYVAVGLLTLELIHLAIVRKVAW